MTNVANGRMWSGEGREGDGGQLSRSHSLVTPTRGVGGLREALTRSLRSVKLDVFVELREDNFHLYEV